MGLEIRHLFTMATGGHRVMWCGYWPISRQHGDVMPSSSHGKMHHEIHLYIPQFPITAIMRSLVGVVMVSREWTLAEYTCTAIPTRDLVE